MPPAASEPAGRATSSRAERPLELTIAHTRAATATRPTTTPTITIRRFRFSRRSCSSRSLRACSRAASRRCCLVRRSSVGMGSPSVADDRWLSVPNARLPTVTRRPCRRPSEHEPRGVGRGLPHGSGERARDRGDGEAEPQQQAEHAEGEPHRPVRQQRGHEGACTLTVDSGAGSEPGHQERYTTAWRSRAEGPARVPTGRGSPRAGGGGELEDHPGGATGEQGEACRRQGGAEEEPGRGGDGAPRVPAPRTTPQAGGPHGPAGVADGACEEQQRQQARGSRPRARSRCGGEEEPECGDGGPLRCRGSRPRRGSRHGSGGRTPGVGATRGEGATPSRDAAARPAGRRPAGGSAPGPVPVGHGQHSGGWVVRRRWSG